MPYYEVATVCRNAGRAGVARRRLCKTKKKFLKQDQNGILAQNFCRAGNFGWQLFRERHIQRPIAPGCQVPRW
jgi:hypothetical protein